VYPISTDERKNETRGPSGASGNSKKKKRRSGAMPFRSGNGRQKGSPITLLLPRKKLSTETKRSRGVMPRYASGRQKGGELHAAHRNPDKVGEKAEKRENFYSEGVLE